MSELSPPISDVHFESLVYGPGDEVAVEQVNLRDMLDGKEFLRWAFQFTLQGKELDLDEADLVGDAINSLIMIQETHPDVVAQILRSPALHVFFDQFFRDSKFDEVESLIQDRLVYLAGLGGFAIAAAHASGQELSVRLPTHGGNTVLLPMLGVFTLGNASVDTITVTAVDNGVVVNDGVGSTQIIEDGVDLSVEGWRPVRRLEESGGMSLSLDDTDPNLDSVFQHPIERPPLTNEEYKVWAKMFPEAWKYIEDLLPDYAKRIKQRITTIVPADVQPIAASLSMMSSAAPGAIGMSLPHSAFSLAAHIINGYRKGLLPKIMEGRIFVGPNLMGDGLIFSPSSYVPETYDGLFQQAYIYTSLLDFYGERYNLSVDGSGAEHTAFMLASWFDEVGKIFEILESAPELTGSGRLFLSALQAKRADWSLTVLSLPEEAHYQAMVSALDHRISWRVYHARPDAEAVQQLAIAWQTGRSARGIVVRSHIEPRVSSVVLGGRKNRRACVEVFTGTIIGFSAALTSSHFNDLKRGDIEFAKGQIENSHQFYLETILSEPGDIEAWTGFALTYHGGVRAVAYLLQNRPEVVMSLYVVLRERYKDEALKPETVAEWLSKSDTLGY